MRKLLVVGFLALSSQALAGSVYQLDWMNHSERPGTEKLTLGQANNKVYVVEAWFNGCPYCHENAPNVDALATTLASNSQITVIDLGRDRRTSDYTSWINRHHPNHPVVRDGDSQSLLSQLQVSGYPTTVVLDCNLQVKMTKVGTWEEGDAEELAAKAREVSQAGCTVR